MSLAKQKAYERMLADLERQEEAMRREKERLDNITDEEMKAKKEAERLKRLAVIEERERRVRERAQRKLDRDGAVLKKRREQDAKMKAYKEEQERLVFTLLYIVLLLELLLFVYQDAVSCILPSFFIKYKEEGILSSICLLVVVGGICVW